MELLNGFKLLMKDYVYDVLDGIFDQHKKILDVNSIFEIKNSEIYWESFILMLRCFVC